MDFLTFTYRMEIKPYQKIQIQTHKSQRNFKMPKHSSENPLLDCLPKEEPIKSDQFEKNFEELIHNAQVAKKFAWTAADEEDTKKYRPKFSQTNYRNKHNNNNKNNTLSLTPYQKYEQERQFTIENIKTKQRISNVNKYFEKNNNQCNYHSPLNIKRRKLINVPKAHIKIKSNPNASTSRNINRKFHISNSIIKDLNKTNTNFNNLFDVKHNTIKTKKKKETLFNTGIYLPLKNIYIENQMNNVEKHQLSIKT